MELLSLLIIVGIAFGVVIIGRILAHSLKFIFYLLLILLVVVFVFGVSLTEFLDFIKNLVFLTF